MISTQYQPPLAIHLVWHPGDKELVGPILQAVSAQLTRNIERPFSRNLNIPLFMYSSNNPKTVPHDFPHVVAERNVLVIFTSINTRGYDSWNDYISSIPSSPSMRIVPVALSPEGLGHGDEGALKSVNFIRSYQWLEGFWSKQTLLAIIHEIYRHGFVEISENDEGKSSSIKIFLSHAKHGDTGRLHAEALKCFIDSTNMRHFFDATDISPGFNFDSEIINAIKDSTIVAICSDSYSGRYWCQKEILCAKEHHRPMIAVDCLEDYEDRIFPGGSNIPCVHVPHDSPISASDMLRVLIATIVETIRHAHSLKSLEYYKKHGWIDNDCFLSSRPPELRQLLSLKNQGRFKICYPDPPIYSEEAAWHSEIGIDSFTPLWSVTEASSLKGMRVGISISDVPSEGFSLSHLPELQTTRLAQDLARHLLARSATLVYGGDLRKDGFTEFILEEAVALKNRLCSEEIHVENHLAWPIYLGNSELIEWRANYRSVMSSVEHEIPDDIVSKVETDNFLPPSNPQDRYYWSRCLTSMRLKIVDSSHARICVGGKLCGYNGKMPGVLEEILISFSKGKPLYLLGAFGGVAGEVCKILRGEGYSEFLTEDWQVAHNDGYGALQVIAFKNGTHTDYHQLKTVLTGVSLSSLAKRAGLDDKKYLRLMESPFVDECIHIILQGLRNVGAQGGPEGHSIFPLSTE